MVANSSQFLQSERPQSFRARMYKKDPDGIDNKVVLMEDAETAIADGWTGTFSDYKSPDELGATPEEQMSNRNAIDGYCRDWNLHLNLHLLRGKIGKANLVALYKRALNHEPNRKMTLGAMKRDFERRARKMGVWMGDES